MTWLVKKALLEELKEFKMSITGSKNAMALMVMDETKRSIMRIVAEQPTVYDKEKVVERLEELHKSISCDNWYAAEKVYEAIEIVKGNGEKKMMCIGDNKGTVEFDKSELEILFTLASERLGEMRDDIQSKDPFKFVQLNQLEAKISSYIFLMNNYKQREQ